MANFNEREKGYEEKFRHDEELAFKAKARRNRLFGLWAAEKLGLAGEEAAAYAKDVVAADFVKPGDDDVIEKVSKDFAAKGVKISDAQLRDQFGREAVKAKREIAGE